jgi:hypothetical protein
MRTILALAVALTVGSSASFAQTPDEKIAKAHFGTGQDYFNAGRYEPAVKEFLEAYRLSHKVDLLWNIAHCYGKLDDPGRMTSYFHQYLKARPAAEDRKSIEAEMEKVAPRVATVALHSEVPGSELRVDGEVVGLAPIEPILLTMGKHHFEASHAEHAPAQADVDLPGGRSTDLSLDPKAIDATPVVVQAPILVAPPVEPPRRRWIGPVVGVVAAVVVAAVVVAVLFSVGGTNYSDRGRALCVDPANCTLIDGSH